MSGNADAVCLITGAVLLVAIVARAEFRPALAGMELDRGQILPGETIRATYTFRSNGPSQSDMSVFVHVVRPDGQRIGADFEPGLSTAEWPADRFVQKPLKNGDIAVGLFNRSDGPQRMTASWRYLDISDKWKARDLWAHKDLGEFEGGYSCQPAGHEMVVLRLSRVTKSVDGKVLNHVREKNASAKLALAGSCSDGVQHALQPSDPAISGVLAPDASSEWEMGPFVKLGKPVLSPNPEARFQCPILGKEVRWEEQNVYNPAAVVRDGKVYLLYRADDKCRWKLGNEDQATSRIGLAWSEDGRRFTRHPTPVVFPDKDAFTKYEWPGGCQDVHVVEGEDGTYYMNYTAWGEGGMDSMCVATSKDLVSWEKHGPAFAKFAPGAVRGSRSGVVVTRQAGEKLLPVKINGQYIMYYTHPSALAVSDNLIDWKPLGKSVWPGGQHESGAIALWRDDGILLMFNGQNLWNLPLPSGTWALGQALIDREDLVTARQTMGQPFLQPEFDWERKGFCSVPATVANGLVYFKGEWLLYYGAADRHVGLGVCKQQQDAKSQAGFFTPKSPL